MQSRIEHDQRADLNIFSPQAPSLPPHAEDCMRLLNSGLNESQPSFVAHVGRKCGGWLIRHLKTHTKALNYIQDKDTNTDMVK